MLKKLLSVFLVTLICFSVFLPSMSIVSQASVYSNADIYAADCITKGVCNPVTGESTGNDPQAYSVILRDYTFELIAEEVIDNGTLVFNSVYWQNLRKTIDGKFLEITNWQEAFYTVLIMDFLTYHTESEEFKSNLTKNTIKFANEIYGNILDYADDSLKGDMEKYLSTWTVSDAIEFSEKHGLVTALKNYHTLKEDIGKVASNAKDYYKNLSKALAVQEANQGNLQFLLLLKNHSSGNAAFSSAVDKVLEWYTSSFGELAFSNGVSTMVGYSVEAVSDCIIKAFPKLEAAVKGLKVYTAGLNWMFNSDDLSENNLKIILLYILNSYAIQALQSVRDEYKSNPNETNAVLLNNTYTSFLDFQNYASYHTKGFISSALFNGLFNTIKNLFSDENELTYQELSQRIDSDMNYTKGLNRLFENYFGVYQSKNGHNVTVFSDDYSGSSSIHGVSFLEDTFNMYLNGYASLPVSVSYSGNADYVLSYSSSNTSVAKVDSNGVITPVSAGTTTIKVNCEIFSDTCVVTVLPFYASNGEGGYIISGYVGSSSTVSIPKYIQGRLVVGIGDSAFYWKSNITSVSIPSSVKTIGKSAFYYCSKLTNINIPDSVTSIGESAFAGCSKLSSVTLSKNMTKIEENTFQYCTGLTSVTIPEGIKALDDDALYGCSSLTSVTLPQTLTTIGDEAFHNCRALKSINIPASVTQIVGYRTFMGCDSLESFNVDENNTVYSSVDGVLFNKGKTNLMVYPINNPRTSYTVPDSVTSINTEAFYNNKNLQNVVLSDSITSMGERVFGFCSNLKSVTWCKNLKTIPNGTFNGCSSFTEFVIPDGVTAIGNSVFAWCDGLKSVTIPETVTSIGGSAFSGCSSLVNIKLPNSLTKIGTGAFFNCYSLESIVIPDGVTSLGDETFYCCENLRDVTLSKNLKSLGYNTFSYCNSLEKIVIPDSVTELGDYSLAFNSNLKEVIIGSGVTQISDGAFCMCPNLESVKLPKNITSIGSEAFYECSKLVLRCYVNSTTLNTVKKKSLKYSIIFDPSDDGAINSLDLTAIINCIFKKTTVSREADCNDDGTVNLKDLVRMKKYLAGIITN